MEESSLENCVLCCREINLYATGPCDHPVCYECSARMRVLCEQNECPICRGDMSYVLFTHKKQQFTSLRNFTLFDKRYMIAFEDEEVQNAFKELLKHSCKACGETLETFDKLKTHVRRQHNLHFCELCVDSLKIFTFERKLYSRKDLAHHKRLGDADDTSHKGHPLCEFCQERFVDLDETFRHLRREHFFCHFCDADGINNFYSDYSYLKDHFRKEHYLCEEGSCAEEQFVGAFRTKIDFQAHKALKHSKNKSKAEVKQNRTLDLEFSFTPRTQNGETALYGEYRRGRFRAQANNSKKGSEEEHNNNRESSENSQDAKQSKSKAFNMHCVEEFPVLSNDADVQSGSSSSTAWSSGPILHPSDTTHGRTVGKSKAEKVNEDFPSLSSAISRPNQKTVSNNTSSQMGVPSGTNSGSSAWGDPQRVVKITRPHNVGTAEKVKPRPWGAVKVTKSEEEFPKLETKKMFRSNIEHTEITTEKPEQRQQWPVTLSSQNAEQLGQQIYTKCKSKKKKNKNAVSELEVCPKGDEGGEVNTDLVRVYGGMSVQSADENEENVDPLQVAKNRCLSFGRQKKAGDNTADDVPWRDKPAFVDGDFPPLEAASSPAKAPPGFAPPSLPAHTAPPPGFSGKLQCKASDRTFNKGISLKAVAQQLSSDQVNGDLEAKDDRVFHPPLCFEKRNNMLINMIYKMLDSDDTSFDKFKLLSGHFRKGKVTAEDYYSECLGMLGRERLQQLFTELVCLLPDISKQQELLKVHNRFMKDASKNRGAVPKNKLSDVCSASVKSCPVCSQVLANNDFSHHLRLHEVIE